MSDVWENEGGSVSDWNVPDDYCEWCEYPLEFCWCLDDDYDYWDTYDDEEF